MENKSKIDEPAEIVDSQSINKEEIEKFHPVDKKKNKFKILLTTVAIVAVLAAGSMVGFNVINNNKANAKTVPTPLKETTDTQSISTDQVKSNETTNEVSNSQNNSDTKSETVNKLETLPTAESLEIDSSLLKTDPEKAVQLYEKNFVMKLLNAGATLENAQKALDSRDIEKYMTQVAAAEDPAIINAFFSEEGLSNPDVIAYINDLKTNHIDVLTYNASTSFPNLDRTDKEPYIVDSEVVSLNSVVENSDGTTTVSFIKRDFDNGIKTHYGRSIFTGEALVLITFKDQNGKLKVVNVVREVK